MCQPPEDDFGPGRFEEVDPDAGKGLHDDSGIPPLLGFVHRWTPLLQSLPLLWSFIKVLPAFLSGWCIAWIIFFVYWGRAGIRDDVAPYIIQNGLAMTLSGIAFHFLKNQIEQRDEVKKVRRAHSEGQLKTNILYRAPGLD
eukprot:Hpha_TRINITY_DN20582_c0_g1::TRINITY_DN20582_c0_g1_i1::g.30755::m.30755